MDACTFVLMRSEDLEQQHVRDQSRVTHRSTDGVACDQCANRSIALDASGVITTSSCEAGRGVGV
jgi:hypothetical protein